MACAPCLLLYLVKSLSMGDNKGFAVYGAYTALVYVMPVIGGRIADQILGSRIAVLLGGILMAIGEFIIVGGTEMLLFWGMAVIIVGNGLFKPNISTMVGKLVPRRRQPEGQWLHHLLHRHQPRRPPGHHGLRRSGQSSMGRMYGFALAGAGMLLGVFVFQMGSKHYAHVSAPPSIPARCTSRSTVR
jgi:POT family proton-dependent oligopeptide transporter